jgi:hypothetical protein
LLCIEAILLDSIKSVSPSLREGLNEDRNIMAVVEPICTLPNPYPTGEHLFEVLFRTLVQNSFNDHRTTLTPDYSDGVPYKEVQESFQSWLKFFIACRSHKLGFKQPLLEASEETVNFLLSSPLFPSPDDIVVYYQRFVEICEEGSQPDREEWIDNTYYREISSPMSLFDAMTKAWNHRSLVTSNRGLLGITAITTQEGDEIWILRGARVPFVVRPLSNGNHLLVGEAYVHGFMNGEIFTRDGVGQETAKILKLE